MTAKKDEYMVKVPVELLGHMANATGANALVQALCSPYLVVYDNYETRGYSDEQMMNTDVESMLLDDDTRAVYIMIRGKFISFSLRVTPEFS